MPTLNVKNPGGAEVFINDVGTNIPALSTVPFSDRGNLLKLANSDSLRALLQAGSLILNDGSADLSAAEAIGLLESIWSNAASGLVPMVPVGFIFNARLSWDSISQVSIGTAGQLSAVKDSKGMSNISWKGILTASMAVSGAGGLQTGSVEAANTWYRVLVIADSTGVNAPAALLVPEGTSFSQAGYDIFRRVGYARNNGSSNFLKFFQAGDGSVRFIYYDETAAVLAALLNGNATAFADVSLATLVPPIGRATVYLGLAFENVGGGTAATDELMLRPKGSTIATPVIRMAPGILLTQKQKQNVLMFVDATQTLQYQVSANNDGADIAVVGYYDEL